MTRSEYISICRECKNRGFDPNVGIICNLSGSIANFDAKCDSFILDEVVHESRETIENEEGIPLENIDDSIKVKLLLEQNFNFAIIGGIIAVLLSAFLWAAFSVVVALQFGYMAILVGLITGFSIKLYGSGVEKKFQILGAVFSLTGCLLGNLFAQVGFIANDAEVTYLQVISVLTPSLILEIMKESFNPIDLLFYFLAIAAGYNYSVIKITPVLINKIKDGTQNKIDVIKDKLRLPVVVISILLILFIVAKLFN